MFYQCSSLTNLPDISKWNTSNLNYMNGIFEECLSLSYFPNISKWDLSQVNNLDYFLDCINSLSILFTN